MVGVDMIYKIGVVIGIGIAIIILKFIEVRSVNKRKAKKWQHRNQ